MKSSLITKHTYEVLDAVAIILEAMLNQQTGLRGYIVLVSEDALTPFTQGQAQYTAALETAKRLTADNPAQQKRLAAVAETAEAWSREFASPVLSGLRDPQGLARALEIAKSGAGKQIFDRFRVQLREIEDIERDLLDARSKEFQSTSQVAQTIAITAIIVTIIGAILLSVFANRGITAPVVRMTASMEALSRKAYDAAIPGANRQDEIGKMAQTLLLFRASMQQADALALE